MIGTQVDYSPIHQFFLEVNVTRLTCRDIAAGNANASSESVQTEVLARRGSQAGRRQGGQDQPGRVLAWALI